MLPIDLRVLTPSRLLGIDLTQRCGLSGPLAVPFQSCKEVASRVPRGSVRRYDLLHQDYAWLEQAENWDFPVIIANACRSSFRSGRLRNWFFVHGCIDLRIVAVLCPEVWGKDLSVNQVVAMVTEADLSSRGKQGRLLGQADEIAPQHIAERTDEGTEMNVHPALAVLNAPHTLRRTDVVLRHGIEADAISEVYRSVGLRTELAMTGTAEWAPWGSYVRTFRVAQALANTFARDYERLEGNAVVRDYVERDLVRLVRPDDWVVESIELLS